VLGSLEFWRSPLPPASLLCGRWGLQAYPETLLTAYDTKQHHNPGYTISVFTTITIKIHMECHIILKGIFIP